MTIFPDIVIQCKFEKLKTRSSCKTSTSMSCKVLEILAAAAVDVEIKNFGDGEAAALKSMGIHQRN